MFMVIFFEETYFCESLEKSQKLEPAKNFVPQQQCDWVWVPDLVLLFPIIAIYGWKDMEIVEEIILYFLFFSMSWIPLLPRMI